MATDRMTPETLLSYLDDLGITHNTISHPPVYTVEEAKKLRGTLPGANCKSLFLKSKRGDMWLVVVAEDHRVNLEGLAESLGSKRLSFASPERLMGNLGVIPGAVSPLAVVNDPSGDVTVVLFAEILDHDVLNFHPLVNDRTTALAASDFLRFLQATGHEPLLLPRDVG
jgi:Ala-tRNA(Pro) deacylase